MKPFTSESTATCGQVDRCTPTAVAKKRRKRYGSARHKRRSILKRQVSEARSEAVEQRTTFGHWEADTAIGRNHKCAPAIVWRKSGVGRVTLLKSHHAQGVADALIDVFRHSGALVKCVTFDSGFAFSAHEYIAYALNCKFYVADPYLSWERGLNKNWNDLLRECNPKEATPPTSPPRISQALSSVYTAGLAKGLSTKYPSKYCDPP